MKRLVLRLAVAIGGLCLLTGLFTSPRGRARGYVALQQAWTEHWPFSRGRHFVTSVSPLLRRLGAVGPVRVELEPGVSLQADPDDYVGREILVTGTTQPTVWARVESHLAPGGVMIDVGAHIGSFALRAARRVGAQGRVVAVEPNPAVAEQLRQNIRFSEVSNVTVIEAACGEAAGRVEFFLGGAANSSIGSLSKDVVFRLSGVNEATYEVEMIPLDEIVSGEGLNRVDLIKIDTEGAELRVLRGGARTIDEFRPAIVLEAQGELLAAMGDSLDALESWLAEAGYRKGRADAYDAEWLPSVESRP